MADKNQTADNRAMATDAVATIGMLIPDNAGRDAIHLAVEPVVAGERLAPGQHIGFLPDGTVGTLASEMLGIVDPFLKSSVFPGERFWLVVYPRTITSLRHVWAHPAFADASQAAPASDGRELSRQWLASFADRLFSYDPDEGSRFDVLISSAENGCMPTDIEYDAQPTSEFWDHFERYTGRKVVERHEYFRCAC